MTAIAAVTSSLLAGLACPSAGSADVTATVPAAAQDPSDVTWYSQDFAGVLRLAAQRGRNALCYFWMDGSQHCQNLWSETLSAPAERARLGRFVCFSANVTGAEASSLLRRYGVTTLPTLLVVAPNGQVDDAILGYVPTSEFDQQIDRIARGVNTVSALRAAASADPDDLGLRFDLALKLAYVGDIKTSSLLLDSIRAEDPDGRTVGGAKVALRDATQQVTAAASDPNDPRTFDLRPVRELLRTVRHPEVVFQGWDWLASTERLRGDAKAARVALIAAAPHLPADRVADWPATVSGVFWLARSDLDPAERGFVRELVERAYGPVDRDARTAEGSASTGGTDEQRAQQAFRIAALARGRFLDGATEPAFDALRLALRLDPENEEIQALQQAMEAAAQPAARAGKTTGTTR